MNAHENDHALQVSPNKRKRKCEDFLCSSQSIYVYETPL